MKSIIFAIVAAASISASAEYVTVEVCGLGESGNVCQMVTYKVRAPSAPVEQVENCNPSADYPQACPTVYGVPGWLKKLNAYLLSQGFEAPAQDDPHKGGN